jgi:hypothetical protein
MRNPDIFCDNITSNGGKRPLGRPRNMWEDNIRLGLREIGWEGVDWIHLAQDRDQWCDILNTLINLQVA